MNKPHRFAIGQSIEINDNRTRFGIPSGTYRVVRHVPNEGGDREYVVRSKSETHDRVVPESVIRAPLAEGGPRAFS